MRLKAQRMIDGKSVCQTNRYEKEGTIRVKPTTFNEAVDVKASVLCPTCECEKVYTQIFTYGQQKLKGGCLKIPTSHSQTVVRNAARCHGHGDLVCGKCQCHDGW